MTKSVFGMAVILFVIVGIFSVSELAKAEIPIVIAQVQAGASDGASREYVSLYNRSTESVDVTDWCLFYNTSLVKPGCLVAPDAHTRLKIKPNGFATFASTEFVTAYPGFIPNAAGAFSAGLSDTGGQLTLFDNAKTIVDHMSWSKKPAVGNIYQRGDIIIPGGQSVVNVEADGWGQAPLIIPESNGLEEIPIYICENLGFGITDTPPGFMADEDGNCFVDECPNITGLQDSVPLGFYKSIQNQCKLITAALTITEVLPNISGTDTGKEFIELYNATGDEVSLRDYILFVGPNYENSYLFPANSYISPHSYLAFYDSELGFTLSNTSAKLKVESTDGQIVSEVPLYLNPKEDISWSLIDGMWQYTNRPTPGSDNLIEETRLTGDKGESNELGECPVGKYRNPDTNRCRNNESSSSTLTPCAIDQVRNPDTNRCRSVLTSTSTLLSCSPGQIRNPETNRCRKTDSTSSNTQKPCLAGQERNPVTNRCRKKVTSGLSKTIKDREAQQKNSPTGWLLTAGAVVGFGGYGVWEWRSEVVGVLRKLQRFFGKTLPGD